MDFFWGLSERVQNRFGSPGREQTIGSVARGAESICVGRWLSSDRPEGRFKALVHGMTEAALARFIAGATQCVMDVRSCEGMRPHQRLALIAMAIAADLILALSQEPAVLRSVRIVACLADDRGEFVCGI